MKKTGINLYDRLIAGSMVIGLLLMNACNILNSNSHNTAGPVVTGVRDIHPDSAAVSKIGPGQTVVVEGKNLATTKEVDFDGFTTSINQTLYTDTTVIATIPSNLPFNQIKSDSLNVIHVVTKYGQTTFKFPILPPTPDITGISDEFATPGTKITISGQFLYLVKSVTFPGGINATNYSSSPDGTSLTLMVPAGATHTGSIKVVTAAGTALSGPSNVFRDTAHVFLNFDNKNAYSTWNTPPDPIVVTPATQLTDSAYNGSGNHVKLSSPIPSISMQSGNYLLWNVVDIPVGTWWVQHLATPTNGSGLAWPSDISTSTSASKLAIKFEVNFPGNGVSSGEVKFEINGKYDYYWKPWANASNGTFKTNGWRTITIPLSDFNGVSTYGDIKGTSFNMFYDNGNGTGNVSWVVAGWDNFRIVPD